MQTKSYRPGACIVVQKATGTAVLICHRLGAPVGEGWQFPQGGVRPRRIFLKEALRELHEETGISNVELIRSTRRAFTYDFPAGLVKNKKKRYQGQRLRWVLVRLRDDKPAVSFVEHGPAEFDAFRWVAPRTALKGIVDFKRDCYCKGLKELGLI